MNKQPNSRYCFLCGIENPIGLNLRFYEDDQGRVVTHFAPGEEHQGFPGVLHGGLISALLDETIGRTLTANDQWAMTIELRVRFHRPVPLGETLTVTGEMRRLRSRTMEGYGELRLADGTLGASAEATYYIISMDQTEAFRAELGTWRVIPEEEEPVGGLERAPGAP